MSAFVALAVTVVLLGPAPAAAAPPPAEQSHGVAELPSENGDTPDPTARPQSPEAQQSPEQLSSEAVAASSEVAYTATVAAQTRYTDVSAGDTHYPAINALADLGIFEGTDCGPNLFCPAEPLPRWAVAVWLVRVLDGGDPSPRSSRFADVTGNPWWEPHVERLAELEVTVGCRTNPLRYCPDRNVTRAHMAAFLVRAFDLTAGPDAEFTDVTASDTHYDNINALFASGITVGCRTNPLRYCPTRDTRRANMAAFLWHAAQEEPTAETPDGESAMPGPPRNVRVDYKEGVSLTVQWEPPNNGGNVEYYGIDVIGAGEFFPPVESPTDVWDRNTFLNNRRPIGNIYDDGREQYSYVLDDDTGSDYDQVSAIRVISVNQHSYGISEEIPVASKGLREHNELRAFVSDLVASHRDHVPWLGEMWTYITEREVATDPRYHGYRSKVVTFQYIAIPKVTGQDISSGFALPDTECLPPEICKAASAGFHIRYGYLGSPLIPSFVVAHELGHIYTQSNDAPSNPLAIVAGYLYLQDLFNSDPLWPSGKVSHFCNAAELYADLAALLVIENIYGTIPAPRETAYWPECAPAGYRAPPDEAIAVARSSLSGQVPQWFYETYQTEDGDYRLEELWQDVITVSGDTGFVVYALRDHFGGYCPDALQQIATGAYHHLEVSNPWRDGGCQQPTTPAGQFTAVSAGYHTCGLHNDGSVECWGYNPDGRTEPPEGPFVSISAGVCGVRADGTIQCWGNTSELELPDGQFMAVSVGGYDYCGIRVDRTIECGWGHSRSIQTEPPAGQFTSISIGTWHACGIRAEGTVECWGRNNYGANDAPSGIFNLVSSGTFYSCGVRADGAVECWGRNLYGLLDPPAGRFVSVSAARNHACGITIDGGIACWGNNTHGQTDAPSGFFQAVSAGRDNTCGVRIDGTIACWGSNAYGQIGVPS